MTRRKDAPQQQRRLALLDFLRFIAAMGVLFYHYTASKHVAYWAGGASPLETFGVFAGLSRFGAFGVQLFFIISGFVILLSISGKTTSYFVASRASRLAPAYLLAVVVSGILLPLIKGEFSAKTVDIFLVNLTMLQSPLNVAHVDGVFWTLTAELFFYLLLGLLLLSGITYHKLLAAVVLWPPLAALGGNKGFFMLFNPKYAPLFALGMTLYLIYEYGHNLTHWGIIVFNFAFSAHNTHLHFTHYIVERTGLHTSFYDTAFTLLLAFVAVAVATLTSAASFTGKMGLVTGRLTYPLYLLHVPIGFSTIPVVSPYLNPWGTLATAILLSCAGAALVNRYVEQPLSPRIRASIYNTLAKA